MYYFRFEIPLHGDTDQRIGYSPGWHGVMARRPENVEVLLYNDAEGYGIARADDTFIPPEVEVITEQDWLDESGGLEVKVQAMASARAQMTRLGGELKQSIPLCAEGIEQGIWHGENVMTTKWAAVKDALNLAGSLDEVNARKQAMAEGGLNEGN